MQIRDPQRTVDRPKPSAGALGDFADHVVASAENPAPTTLDRIYQQVITRDKRLKRLIDLRAPDIVVRSEKRLLQQAVDALFDEDEVLDAIALLGANHFILYFNHVAGTELEVSHAATAAASRAA